MRRSSPSLKKSSLPRRIGARPRSLAVQSRDNRRPSRCCASPTRIQETSGARARRPRGFACRHRCDRHRARGRRGAGRSIRCPSFSAGLAHGRAESTIISIEGRRFSVTRRLSSGQGAPIYSLASRRRLRKADKSAISLSVVSEADLRSLDMLGQ